MLVNNIDIIFIVYIIRYASMMSDTIMSSNIIYNDEMHISLASNELSFSNAFYIA